MLKDAHNPLMLLRLQAHCGVTQALGFHGAKGGFISFGITGSELRPEGSHILVASVVDM